MFVSLSRTDELDCNVKSGPPEAIGSESAIVDAGLEGKSAVLEATRKAKTRDFKRYNGKRHRQCSSSDDLVNV